MEEEAADTMAGQAGSVVTASMEAEEAKLQATAAEELKTMAEKVSDGDRTQRGPSQQAERRRTRTGASGGRIKAVRNGRRA